MDRASRAAVNAIARRLRKGGYGSTLIGRSWDVGDQEDMQEVAEWVVGFVNKMGYRLVKK